MPVFFQGSAELATLTNTFLVNGVATDPTTISLTVTSPSGTATTYTYAGGAITRTGTGAYSKDIPCTENGVWLYTWTGTGLASDVVSGSWTVVADESRLYATVEELKRRLAITTTTDDEAIRFACETASRFIDEHCDRHFWRGTATRTFVPDGYYCLEIDDVVSITTLATDASGDGVFETTWTTSDYRLWPPNALTKSEPEPYTEIRTTGTKMLPAAWIHLPSTRDDRVQITGVFGWPAVPSAVKQAALILAADFYKIKDAPLGVQSYGDFAVRVRDKNPRAIMMLAPYRRYPVLVA